MPLLRIFLTLIFTLTFFVMPGFVWAGNANVPDGQSQILGGVMTTGRDSTLNQTAGGSDLQTLIGQIIGSALSLIGLIFFILTVYGGFLWMTAHGEEDQIETGQKTIKAAVIGMIVIFSAYAITRLVLDSADSAKAPTDNGGGCVQPGYSCQNINGCDPVTVVRGLCPGGNQNVCCAPAQPAQ